MVHLHPALFLVTTLLIILLPHSSWGGYDYDTTTEDTGTPPQSSDNLCVESYNDNGISKSRATACPEDTQYTKYFCAIYKKYGIVSPGHCIKSDECPSGVSDDKIVCQKDNDYCCCKNTPGRYPKDTLLACNDIENPKNDMIWKQFCSLRVVKYDEYCLKGPKNKPGLKWNEMAPQCLDYCNEKRGTDYNGKPKTGGYSLRCNNRVDGQGKWNCPHPCPVECDQYCEDGEHMECPEIPGPPTKPSSEEPYNPEEGGNGENDKKSGLTGVEIGAIVVVLIVVGAVIGVIVYCCRRKENPDLAMVHAPLPGQQLSVMQRNVTPTMSSAQFASGQGSGQVLQQGQNGSVAAGGGSAPNPNPAAAAASPPVATTP